MVRYGLFLVACLFIAGAEAKCEDHPTKCTDVGRDCCTYGTILNETASCSAGYYVETTDDTCGVNAKKFRCCSADGTDNIILSFTPDASRFSQILSLAFLS